MKIIQSISESKKTSLFKLIYIEGERNCCPTSTRDWTHPLFFFFFFVGWKCKYLMKMQFFWFKSVHAPSYAHQVLAQVVVLLFQMERGTLIYYTWQVITWYMPVTKTYPSTFITNLLLLKESGPQTWEFTFFLILSFLLSIRETCTSKK